MFINYDAQITNPSLGVIVTFPISISGQVGQFLVKFEYICMISVLPLLRTSLFFVLNWPTACSHLFCSWICDCAFHSSENILTCKSQRLHQSRVDSVRSGYAFRAGKNAFRCIRYFLNFGSCLIFLGRSTSSVAAANTGICVMK